MTFATSIRRHTLEALDTALCFGWIDGVVGRLDDDHCALRFTRRRPGSSWRVVNLTRFGPLFKAHTAAWAFFEQQPPGCG